MSLIQETLRALLPPKRKTTSGGWISFNAPCCVHKGESQDTRQRGGILFEGEGFVWHCFNCGFKAGWKPGKLVGKNTKDLLRWLGLPETEINRLILDALKDKDTSPLDNKALNFELHEEALPGKCQSIMQWLSIQEPDSRLANIVEYILSRGLTLDDYDWHWSDCAGYQDRVIIPFYHDKKVVGWTARKINNGRPRYLTKSQPGYVFNLDAQHWDRKYLIVVEGQFDAIAIGGVAIMTNEPNEVQCARINSTGKPVIVVPDRDRPGAKLLKSAIDNGWSMSFPPWADDIKDVADAVLRYGKLYTLATILHYRETNKIKIELQKKKLEKLDDK